MKSSALYLAAGFLLGNGFPHFAFGVAGQIFRSPFARQTEPNINIAWGIGNFIVGSAILFWLSRKEFNPKMVMFLLLCFWLAVAMFGLFIKDFIVT